MFSFALHTFCWSSLHISNETRRKVASAYSNQRNRACCTMDTDTEQHAPNSEGYAQFLAIEDPEYSSTCTAVQPGKSCYILLKRPRSFCFTPRCFMWQVCLRATGVNASATLSHADVILSCLDQNDALHQSFPIMPRTASAMLPSALSLLTDSLQFVPGVGSARGFGNLLMRRSD